MDTERADECNRVLAQLNDYLDQEQTPAEMHRVMAHLDRCPACAARCDHAYQELAALREAAQQVRAPAGLMDRISRSLAQYPGKKEDGPDVS
jgi:anti-sigma factor (TIGR02949 family)